ncbi:hypothetical protein DK867_08190 [Ochrobactrum sp. POC9]|nr:hypothetical protein DK867_08190 [Ochrobactrum sp. POC9]
MPATVIAIRIFKCLIQKSPRRFANGDFRASGAQVPLSTLRSSSRNHHFRHGQPLFDSDTIKIEQSFFQSCLIAQSGQCITHSGMAGAAS